MKYIRNSMAYTQTFYDMGGERHIHVPVLKASL